MSAYVIRRLLQMIPVLVLVSVVSFSLIFVLPGDPALHPLTRDDQVVGTVGDLAHPVLRGQVVDHRLLHRERGYVEPLGELQRLAAQTAGGGDVHQVGSEALERGLHLPTRLVERPDPGDPVAAVRRQSGSGRDDQDLVPGVDEPVGEVLDRGGRGVDGRVVRLGDQSNPHAASVRQ